jgi:hypothetical protein
VKPTIALLVLSALLGAATAHAQAGHWAIAPNGAYSWQSPGSQSSYRIAPDGTWFGRDVPLVPNYQEDDPPVVQRRHHVNDDPPQDDSDQSDEEEDQ